MTTSSAKAQKKQIKRDHILQSALRVFGENGYNASTMDALAAAAGVTKPTLYQYFANKEDLFTAMLLAPRDQMLLAFEDQENACFITQLWQFSWTYADIVLHPDYLALARLVIADAHRLPDLGRAYQASGPDLVLRGLAIFLGQQHMCGKIDAPDPVQAAEDFWGLILSAPRNRALHVPDYVPNQREIASQIHNGISVFIRAYSNHREQDLKTLSKVSTHVQNGSSYL